MLALDSSIALSEQPLMTHFDTLWRIHSNRAISPAGLAIGTASATAVKIVNTVTYLSNGVFKAKAPAEVAFTPVTHDIPASLTGIQEQVYLLTLDGNGNPTLTGGGITTGAGTAPLPQLPATGSPVAFVRIAVAAAAPGAGTNFVAGTTVLSASYLTVGYSDVGYYAGLFSKTQ